VPSRWPMLMLRGSTWYYRRFVPLKLQPLLGGRREVWKSLRTSDFDEAKLLSLRVGQDVEKEFQALKKRAATLQASPETLARAYEKATLTTDTQWRATRGAVDDETLDAELLALTSAVEDHAEALRLGDAAIISKLLDEVLSEQGLHVPAQRRAEFAHALLRAHVRALEVVTKRTRGEWNGEPSAEQQDGTTVEDLLDAYLRERKLGSKSEAEIRAAYRRFMAVGGGQYKLAREVTKADARAYKESLLAAPSNRSLSKDGKLSAKSIKKLMTIVATVFRWGINQGLLDANPFEGLTRTIRGDRGATVERRLPYDGSDIKTIFGSEEFQKLTGAKQWLPLIALHSGCRLEEAGGLRVKDVREDEGIHFFDFVPTTERRLKTASSRRRVPIHPELLKLGLLDYVKSAPQDGRLFPELKPGPHGMLTGAFSKWWARFTDDLGVNDPRKTFHSLRHSFKDACRAAGLPEEVHDALTGHVSGTVGRRYGTGFPLRVLAESVAKVSYPGLGYRT